MLEQESGSSPSEMPLQREHQEPLEGLVAMREPVRVRIFLNFGLLANRIEDVNLVAVPLSPNSLIARFIWCIIFRIF
jgi:hypothetical protein